MKQHIRMFSVLLILTFLLVSCETEEVYLKENQHQVDNNRVKLLKGDEAKKILYQLNSKLSGLGSPALNNNIRLRTNGQSIDFNSILQVIDTLGIKNYTFRISNHPDDDYKTFHNLVITDKGTTIETTLMKYEMTEQFAAAYNQRLKLFQQFEGKVTATGFPLSPLSPVPCEEIVKEFNPIPVYEPNPVHNPGGSSPSGGGGSGGSYGGAGTGNGSGSGTGSGGGNSNGATCIEAIARIFCSCGRNYGSLGDYAGSICGDWETNPGYEVYLGFIYVASNNCRLAADPCNPDGVIGILEPTKSTPCDELKLNSSSTDFKGKMQTLKDNIDGTVEKTFGIYNGNHMGSSYPNPTCGAILEGNEENAADVPYHISMKATAHNHLTNPTYQHIGTFSPNDIINFSNMIILGEQNLSPTKKEEFAFYLVCSEGNYVLKVTDVDKLYNFASKYGTNNDFKDKIDKFYKDNKMVHGKEKVEQNIGFLKLMKKHDIGVDYYEADENFENWKKLELNTSGNSINKIPCN